MAGVAGHLSVPWAQGLSHHTLPLSWKRGFLSRCPRLRGSSRLGGRDKVSKVHFQAPVKGTSGLIKDACRGGGSGEGQHAGQEIITQLQAGVREPA